MRLIEVFQLAEEEGLEIHPETMRMARRDAELIKDEVRRDPRANALFLKLLTGRRDPETVLRWMNEAGVFGRFVPDFGKVNAQMQFDMYHHYTVDEHTIRAIGLLAQIERGELREDHPLATELIPQLASRNVLYVATLLHDIAKGRGGDHSVLGAEVAMKLCPRLGHERGRDRADRLAGALAPADELDRVQARPVRPQDDRRFRRAGADARAAAPADAADHRRHPRGRARASGTAGSASCSPSSTSWPRSACGSATSATAARSGSRPRRRGSPSCSAPRRT